MFEVDIIQSLCTLPATDGNFKSALHRANLEQIGSHTSDGTERKWEQNKAFCLQGRVKEKKERIKA